jgi:Aspartyl protease
MLRVGDHAPVPVVFDTGTNGNVVDLKLAAALNLPKTGPSPSIDGSTGKPVPGFDTFIKGASLGGTLIADARATAMDYNVTDEAGIFGPNSFPDKLVRMEGARSRLVIQPKTRDTVPAGKSFAYLGKGGDSLPSATLDFGDLKIMAILDSGNDRAIILPMSYKDKLALDGAPVQIGFNISAAGKQPIYRAHLKGSVKIADAVLDQPEILFMEGGRPNIGLPILRKFTVVFDPTEYRDWILPAEMPKP